MHQFHDLVYRGTAFTLNALQEANNNIIESLDKSGSTSEVKNLQMIQLQKAILAAGMFSLFDSILQDGLSCRNGFDKVKKILLKRNKTELNDRFNDFECAINVLKHGQGKSYDALVAKYAQLPFRIKLPGENFIYEGDVSEISTLVEVNDDFVLNCAELIEKILEEVRKEYPEFYH